MDVQDPNALMAWLKENGNRPIPADVMVEYLLIGLRDVFGRALTQERERVGLSKRKLAARCNVDSSYIGQLESGKRLPSLSFLVRLGVELGCDWRALLS